jgi:hypothetical protein
MCSPPVTMMLRASVGVWSPCRSSCSRISDMMLIRHVSTARSLYLRTKTQE